MFGEREAPASLHIIQDVKDERKQRTREVQVSTAKRILHRFYTKKIRVDQETMTDTDEIAIFKNNFESMLDGMLERELVLKN
jgi:hypothetical protein